MYYQNIHLNPFRFILYCLDYVEVIILIAILDKKFFALLTNGGKNVMPATFILDLYSDGLFSSGFWIILTALTATTC